jgi:epoxyqueuosine reductase QueG
VIVFATNIGLDYYTATRFQGKMIRIGHLYTDSLCSQLVWFLREKGYDAVVPFGFYDEKNYIARLSNKLAAYESGIGIYGRPSIIVTPEYGPRVNLGVVLTDAALQPDEKLKEFEPCKDCLVCMKNCPAGAIHEEKPPTGFDRRRCLEFVLKLREITNNEVMLCGNCYELCPAGQLIKQTLQLTKWKSLLHLEANFKKQVIKAALRGFSFP